MRAKMHVGEVQPQKNWLIGFHLLFKEINNSSGYVVIDGFHSLPGQRPCVFDFLTAIRRREAVDDAARAEILAKIGEFRVVGFWIIRQFGLFLSIQVIKVSVEFVEAMRRGQKLILVAKMVLAELACRIALRLEKLGDRRVFLAQSEVRARQTDFG